MTAVPLTHLARIALVIGAMAASVLAGAAAALFAIGDAGAGLTRVRGAHVVLERHLELDAAVDRLMRLHVEILLFGPDDRRHALAEGERAVILAILAAIRRGIEAEIDLVGAEEVAELDDIAAIGADIAALHEALHGLLDEHAPAPTGERLARARALLDGETATRLRARIVAAIAHEREEVAETNAEIAEREQVLRAAVFGVVALALLVAAGGYAVLRTDIVRPFAALLAGARALGAGQFSHRIAVEGPGDLAALARTFNDMAAGIEGRDREREAARAGLERAVAARTRDLEAALAGLAEADRHRRNLLADVSHELRTPLTIMRGEAEVALRDLGAGPEAGREALVRIRDAVTHAAQIVDDLLFMARTEEGVPRLDLHSVDLVGLVAHMVDLARSLAGPGCRLTFATPHDRAPVRADPRRLRQALLVLLDNAILYGEGEVDVTLDREAEGWWIAVTDNGPGMSEAEIEEAFGRFRRSGAAEARRREGSGLGLPIARTIMEAHGGTARLDRAGPRGTRAVLRLPVRGRVRAPSAE